MKELWKDKKFWLVFGAEMLFIFLSLYFIVLPLVKGIKDKADKIQETKIDRNLFSARLSKIGEARNEYQKLTNGIHKTEVLLESEKEVVFFKELERIAGIFGNEISFKIIEEAKKDGGNAAKASTSVMEKEKKEMLDGLSYKNYFILQINLKGDYYGLVNFLHKLENLNYYLTIVSIEVQKVKELPSGEMAPVGGKTPEPKEMEKLNSLITAAIYKK